MFYNHVRKAHAYIVTIALPVRLDAVEIINNIESVKASTMNVLEAHTP